MMRRVSCIRCDGQIHTAAWQPRDKVCVFESVGEKVLIGLHFHYRQVCLSTFSLRRKSALNKEVMYVNEKVRQTN